MAYATCQRVGRLVAEASHPTLAGETSGAQRLGHRQPRKIVGRQRAVGRDAEARQHVGELAHVLGAMPSRALEQLMQRLRAVIGPDHRVAVVAREPVPPRIDAPEHGDAKRADRF